MKSLPLGISDFRELHKYNKYYVDKTLFIKEIINCDEKIILLPRPRRFGKTMNMSTLKYFFELSDQSAENRKLFSGLAIENEPEFDAFQGKYPIIYVSFKDVKNTDFENAYDKIKNLIAAVYKSHKYLLENLEEDEKIFFQKILYKNANQNELAESLLSLSEYLLKYHSIEPILLIDEYDTPIHTAYANNYYKEMISFLRVLYGTVLKDNINLSKAVLTGILRVAKESIFSGVNNFGVYTLLNNRFSDKFGFTENEVLQLISDYNIQEDETEIQKWYNGYIFGKTIIYNPWSILRHIYTREDGFKPHWVNTASNEIIQNLINKSDPVLKKEFHLLLLNQSITKHLNEDVVFYDLEKDSNNIYTFLVFSGYLKAFNPKRVGNKLHYELKIPNIEVNIEFENILKTWFAESYTNEKVYDLLRSLTDGDVKLFEQILGDFILNTLSYFDTAGKNVEKVYQAFLLGIFVNLIDNYEIKSEQESGHGRYDIALIPHDKTKLAIIMELKSINKKETKTKVLSEAIKQMKERQYSVSIRNRGYERILEFAVTFDGKRCWTKKADSN